MVTLQRKRIIINRIHKELIVGELYIQDHEYKEHPMTTIEVNNPDKISGIIPAGRYRAEWHYTPIHRHHLRIFGLKRRNSVHIKPGRLPLPEGDIILGIEEKDGSMIGSTMVFKELHDFLGDESSFELIVEDIPND